MDPVKLFYWLCVLLVAPFVGMLWVMLLVAGWDFFTSWLRRR